MRRVIPFAMALALPTAALASTVPFSFASGCLLENCGFGTFQNGHSLIIGNPAFTQMVFIFSNGAPNLICGSVTSCTFTNALLEIITGGTFQLIDTVNGTMTWKNEPFGDPGNFFRINNITGV